MKQILLALVLGLVLGSCIDKPVEPLSLEEQFGKDLTTIDNYITQNGLITEIDSLSFIRYNIIEQGDGNSPVSTDRITINYEGRLLTGEIFDQNDTITFLLGGLIGGWQIGLPLLNEGGSMTLYLPSFYGYGNESRPGIPSNSILIFDIDLIKIED